MRGVHFTVSGVVHTLLDPFKEHSHSAKCCRCASDLLALKNHLYPAVLFRMHSIWAGYLKGLELGSTSCSLWLELARDVNPQRACARGL